MTLTPNIVKTDTKKGEITRARRIDIKHQIRLLNDQIEGVKKMEVNSFFNTVAKESFIECLRLLKKDYEIELYNLLDIEDQWSS